MSRRLLCLVTDAYGAGGGIAQYNRDLLDALSLRPDIGEILVLQRSGHIEAHLPRAVRQLAVSPGKLAYTARALWTAWRRGPFDAVFCGHLFAVPAALAAARLARAPLWLQLHGIEAWDAPPDWRRRCAEQARLVTAVSRHTRRLFLTWANCAPECVKVLSDTVEPRFTPGPKDAELIARHRLAGHRVLLTVSRLAASERYKGHELVLQALARLRAAHPDLVYVVAGDGDDLPRLRQRAEHHGVAEQVRFLGFVEEAQLVALYRTADLFVMPSFGEGFGIVFLQALACGLPVVGGAIDGTRDPLQDGHAGVLVPMDVDALTTAIARSLAEPRSAGVPDGFTRAAFERQVGQLLPGLLQPADAAPCR